MFKRWLFVTYTPDPKRPILDPSARYRCFNRVEDLRALGHRAAVTSQQRFERAPPLDYDVYVFHRPWYSQDFEGLLDYLRHRGRRLVADYDEPVFAAPPRTACPPPFPELGALAGPTEPNFIRALRCFHDVGAATRPLADWIAEVHPSARVGVFGSGLGPSWLASAASVSGNLRSEGRSIAVAPGFDTPFDSDLLRVILPAALQRSPSLRMMLGPAARSSWTPSTRASARPVRSLFALARRCHTIAFPSGGNRVDQTITAVRALEAAYLGCRVLASPLPDLMEHRGAGFTFLESPGDWIEALVDAPRPCRKDRAALARAHIDREARSSFQTRRWMDWVEA